MAFVIDGRYEILGQIGEGGFGEVFRARDVQASPDAPVVALKMLRMDRLSDISAVARFKREISLGVELPHPNLIPILDHGEDAGELWCVMPYADGGNLTMSVPRGGLEPSKLLEVLVPIAGAVAHLHDNGALHRDVSPNNVLHLGSKWVLSDLGLSTSSLIPTSYLTSTGVAGLGAIGFVAPEQRSGLKQASTRSDIYSLGKLVQFMSEGAWPEHPPIYANPFAAVINQAIRANPTERFATVHDVVQAVRVIASVPPETGSIADRVDLLLSGSRSAFAAKGAEFSSLIVSLDPDDSFERMQIERLLMAAPEAAWRVAFKADPDQALHAVEVASRAMFDEAEFAKLDGLLDGLLNADRAIDSPQVRHRVVATIVHVGNANNRWSFQRAIRDLLLSRTPDGRMAATVSGFREAGSSETQWALMQTRIDELPKNLRGWLNEIAG